MQIGFGSHGEGVGKATQRGPSPVSLFKDGTQINADAKISQQTKSRMNERTPACVLL
jgi:hypothetical protein